MKKILVFIDWFLPGYKAGGPITSVSNLVESLSDFFEFYIVTSDRDYLEEKPYEKIIANKWQFFDKNIKIIYLSPEKITVKTIKEIVSDSKFDYIYINGIYSLYFSILPVYFAKKNNKKTIIAARGMLSKHSFSRKSKKKHLFLTIAKKIGLYKNVIFHATNLQEKQSIKSIINFKSTVRIAPNLPSKVNEQDFVERSKQANELKLVSIARISTEKNTKFAIEQLKNIAKGRVVFDIYGSIYDKSYWHECKQIISKLPINIEVNYKGVAHKNQVKNIFGKYHFAFMPSKGENFGHSIFEAFSTGTPVITSKNTPWQNLDNKKVGWDIDLNGKQRFLQVINYCINMTQQEYNNLSKNAFKFAQNFIENSDDQGQLFEWDFGDYAQSTEKNPVHVYERAGDYGVTLTVTSTDGCKTTKHVENLIHVYPVPDAKFASAPATASIIKPEIRFYNQTIGATNFYWNFGDGTESAGENVYHTFPAVAQNYIVTMTAETEFGCKDSSSTIISIVETATMYVPTGFTPDGDDINDIWKPVGEAVDLSFYELRVYNRWGEIIWQTSNYDEGWDGTIKGEPAVNGVYFFVLDYMDINGVEYQKAGTFSLFR
jgi:gliding motility-associated-like protein